jgi:hypothetical protein
VDSYLEFQWLDRWPGHPLLITPWNLLCSGGYGRFAVTHGNVSSFGSGHGTDMLRCTSKQLVGCSCPNCCLLTLELPLSLALPMPLDSFLCLDATPLPTPWTVCRDTRAVSPENGTTQSSVIVCMVECAACAFSHGQLPSELGSLSCLKVC